MSVSTFPSGQVSEVQTSEPLDISRSNASVRLKIEGISKYFGAVKAVDNVLLSATQGETIVLLGSSGCGKTTLLRMIAGFSEPTSGSISIDGTIVAGPGVFIPPERRGLSMVFQNYAVWPHKTVGENLAYGLKLKGLSRSDVKDQVRAGLEMVQMASYADRFPGELSGGQQQRVALARALVLEPKLLLFDEPLSNLDAMLREHMRFEIRNILNKLGITSIYVTHDQEEAMVVGDRIAVMNAGRIEQVGTGEEIYRKPKSNFVAGFVGVSNRLPGHFAKSDEGNLVKIDGLGFLKVSETAVPEGAVNVYVRPQDIVIQPVSPVENSPGTATASGMNVLSGIVEQSTFLGDLTDITVKVGQVDIRVIQSSRKPRPAKGQKVSIQIDGAVCSTLPA